MVRRNYFAAWLAFAFVAPVFAGDVHEERAMIALDVGRQVVFEALRLTLSGRSCELERPVGDRGARRKRRRRTTLATAR